MATQSLQWVTRMKHKAGIVKIAFTPDGKYVLTETPPYNQRAVLVRPSMIRVWESATGKEVAWKSLEEEDKKIPAHRPEVGARSSEDDFPSEKEGGQVALLSQASALKELTYYKPDEVLSPDGLWKANKGRITVLKEAIHDKTLTELKHDGMVKDLAFSPDSRWLVTASDDHTVRVWPLTPKDMINEACARLRRNLNEAEWKQYLQGERMSKTCPNLP